MPEFSHEQNQQMEKGWIMDMNYKSNENSCPCNLKIILLYKQSLEAFHWHLLPITHPLPPNNAIYFVNIEPYLSINPPT